MAILTKAQLTTANSSSFPDNNSQLITPQVLRDFNQSVIDTLVDSLDTGSFANTGVSNAFTQANSFTSISASSFVSASNFVGDGSKLTNITASVSLPILDEGVLQGYATSMNFTGSAISASVVAGTAIVNVNIEGAGLVTTQSFNPFTQSVNQFTQSAQTSINALNQSSASQQVSIDALNQFTASQSTASIVNSISSLNQFTQSAEVRLTNLETTSASLLIETQNLELFSASALTSINALNVNSASVNSSITQLNASSASQQVSINAINQATQSLQNRTGSYATTGSNTFSGNQIISGTFQVTDGNDCRMGIGVTSNDIFLTAGGASNIALTFGGDLQLNGDTVGLRNSVGNAQFIIYNGTGAAQKAYSTQVTATGPSGSMLISDVQNNKTYITVGGNDENVYVEAPLRVNAPFTASLQQGYAWVGNASGVSSLVATSSFGGGGSVDTGSLVTTASFNSYTQSNDQRVSSLESNSASVNTSITNLNSATSSLFTSASLGLVTASATGANITFTKGDASQFTITVATGSFVSASYAETSSISRNVVVIARNGGASTLDAGTVVHITGATGDNPIFTTASYDTEALSSNTFGLLRYSSPSGADVEVVVNGVVLGVNTDPALGYAAGDVLYLSSSGQFTKVQPQAPNQIVTIGQVLRAQQNNGSIYVDINNGWELNELHNVQINNAQTGDLLQYESSSYGLWKNKSIEGAGITTTSSFNSYTSSTDARLNNIEAATGSYATTGSNNFNGNQVITGSVTISGSAQTDLTVIGQIFVSSSATGATTAPRIVVSGSQGQSTIQRNQITTRNLTYQNTFSPFLVDNTNLTTADAIGMTIDATTGGVAGWTTGPAIYVNNVVGDTYPAVFGFQNKANYTDGRVAVLTPLSASAGFTASLQNGYAWVGNSLGQNTQVATSSFGTAINTGSFATTGSNTFTGQQTISEGNGLAVVGGGGITLAQNLQNSGSQYASVTIFADPATFGPDLYEGFQVLDNSGAGIVQMAANTYTPQFGGEMVAWIGAGGNNVDGNNTAMIFRTGSADMLVYKPTKFNYPVTISSSAATDLAITGAAKIVSENGLQINTLGSNTFNLNTTKDASVNAENYIFGSTASVSSIYVGVYDDPNFTTDVELKLSAASGGISFNDWDNVDGAYESWLTLAPNVGTNPIPAFTRGLSVTGSTNIQNLTASLQQGYVWVGDSTGRTTTVATSSFGGGGGAAFPYTGSAVITGSLAVTGSVRGFTNTLSVVSSTASINMNDGNFFTLTLPTGSTTHVTVSNLSAGQTINLLVSQSLAATGSIAFAPNIRFAGGVDYTATAITGAMDIVSFVSFDTNQIFATQVKNLS